MFVTPAIRKPLQMPDREFLPVQQSEIVTSRLPPISLEEMNTFAALQTRVDRKYIVTNGTCNELIDGVNIDGQVLEIDGNRSTIYQSIYFDTPELKARREKFKKGVCWATKEIKDFSNSYETKKLIFLSIFLAFIGFLDVPEGFLDFSLLVSPGFCLANRPFESRAIVNI